MYNYIIHKQNKIQRYNRFHIISNFIMKTNVDKYNPRNEFFFNKDGEVKMENRWQYGDFYVGYCDIWIKIKTGFDVIYEYTSKLIQSMVGDVFKIRPLSLCRAVYIQVSN